MKRLLFIISISLLTIFTVFYSKTDTIAFKKIPLQESSTKFGSKEKSSFEITSEIVDDKPIVKVVRNKTPEIEVDFNENEFQQSEKNFDQNLEKLNTLITEINSFNGQKVPDNLANEFGQTKNLLINLHQKYLAQVELKLNYLHSKGARNEK